MYRKELLPDCIAAGMTAEEFWHSYPCEIEPYFEAQKRRRLLEDDRDYICGLYTFEAVSIAVANALRGKHGKIHKYREKPILREWEEQNRPLTEEEIQRQRQMFVDQLMLMKTNFELTKEAEE